MKRAKILISDHVHPTQVVVVDGDSIGWALFALPVDLVPTPDEVLLICPSEDVAVSMRGFARVFGIEVEDVHGEIDLDDRQRDEVRSAALQHSLDVKPARDPSDPRGD